MVNFETTEKISELSDEVMETLIDLDIYTYKDYKSYMNIKNKLKIENNIVTIKELEGEDVSRVTSVKAELKAYLETLQEMMA